MFDVSPCLVDAPVKKKKLGKNPDVDTSFLPDRDREVSLVLVLQAAFGAFCSFFYKLI